MVDDYSESGKFTKSGLRLFEVVWDKQCINSEFVLEKHNQTMTYSLELFKVNTKLH